MNMFKLFFVLTALNFAVIAQDSVCTIDTRYLEDTESVPVLPSLDRTIETDNFVVHYSLTGEHATTNQYAQDVADYAELAYSFGIYEIGYNPPPSDQGLLGGSEKYDIAIVNLQSGLYGVTYAFNPIEGDGSFSYIEVDNTLDELL
ncbi:MAG: hypothetical protein IT279_08060, partial [Ignavibacteriaceae bacterium]|nr:hypothetical protein [Ignavibacteriaceae bacterium]